MPRNLLKNEGFEADWGEEKSHRCLIFPKGREPYETDVGNMFTPPGWMTWFRHDPDTWDQPEARDAWATHDSRRVHGGQKGMLLFTFFRKHDAGFLQQVQVARGTRLRLTAWAHAWSNWHGGLHPDDGRWSDGPGYDAGFCLEGDTSDDNWRNFSFYIGIDPAGGTDPYAGTVVWGRGAHIYNKYAQVPAVETVAQSDTVTVFLRSKTLWPFKHNDAYWDDAKLVVLGEGEVAAEVRMDHRPRSPRVGEVVTIEARSSSALSDVHLVARQPSGTELARGAVVTGRDGDWYTWTYATSGLREVGTYKLVFSAAGKELATHVFKCAPTSTPQRGSPREQYKRTYVLLPPDADAAWALAVVDGMWDQHRYTLGSSADDAGIGDLNVRRVVAVNPGQWSGNLLAFFKKHYPAVEYIVVEASTPAKLARELEQL